MHPRARPLLALALVLLAVLVAFPPATIGGTPRRGNDFDFHTSAVADYRAALADGIHYPRWAAASFGGFGSPAFVFYPPLPHATVALATVGTGDPIAAFHWIAFAVAALGALGVHRLVRRDCGARIATIAAIAWALLPYAAFDYYERFAWAEFCALAWIPFVFLAGRDLVAQGGRSAALRWVFGCTGLALTHLLTAAVCCPVAALWIAMESRRRRDIALFLRLLALSTLACLLAAPYLVPVIAEASHVRLEFTHTVLYGRVHNGGFPWVDPSAFGYSRPARPLLDWAAGGHAALTAGAIATLVTCRALTGTSAMLAIGASALLFLVGPWAEPVWRFATPLQSLQFAYRLLGVQGLLAVWLAARALAAARGRPWARALAVRAGVVASVGVGLAIVWSGQHGDRALHTSSRQRAPAHNLVFEYLPRHVDFASASAQLAALDAPFAVTGDARARLVEHASHETRVAVEAGADGATIVFRRFDFPGWRAAIDGEAVAHEAVPGVGAIAVRVPPGEHRVSATHGPTSARWLGGCLALAGLIALAAASRRSGVVRESPPRATAPSTRTTIACLAGMIAIGLVLPRAWPYPRLARNLLVVTTTPALPDGAPPVLAGAVTRAYRPAASARRDAERLFAGPNRFGAFGDPDRDVAAFVGNDAALAAILPNATATTSADAITRIDAWLADRGHRPFAAWLHVGDVAPPEFTAVVRRLATRLLGSPHDEHTDVVVAGLGGSDGRAAVVEIRPRPPRRLPAPEPGRSIDAVPGWLDVDRLVPATSAGSRDRP